MTSMLSLRWDGAAALASFSIFPYHPASTSGSRPSLRFSISRTSLSINLVSGSDNLLAAPSLKDLCLFVLSFPDVGAGSPPSECHEGVALRRLGCRILKDGTQR